ncbi:hypothetical protein SM11_pC0065 (plasmid) [Sinorhizobium meliloti SM11]|uniref:Uncharacterized protein n=1 Tax=Sinorhizobium meliloti (strain SM11) TaxID=707241 RepID=F7XAV4_SINMM|nr:hypothetical protein SM11_pC0065 [Sinorhizobium meliloti SM11]
MASYYNNAERRMDERPG